MKHNYLKHLFTALLLMCVAVATAHDFEVDGIYYNITDATNKTVAVSYRGSYSDSYSNEYTGSVVIPESVTYNGKTYSVTSIGGDAFYGCTGLTSIEIPNSVTKIGEYAFSGCSGLTSIEIPGSVTKIETGAFGGCTSLKDLHIEDGTETLSLGCNTYISSGTGTGLFYNSPLETLYLGRNLSYKTSAPYGSSPFCKITTLTSAIISNCITSIGGSAFSGCSGLASIEIPNSVTKIGESAFSGCNGLTSIEIPNSVTEIEKYAFRGCTGLTSIVIPNSVTKIGVSVFENCTGLTSVEFNAENCISMGSSSYPVFNGCTALSTVTIGENVKTIPRYTFDGCNKLVSLKSQIPADKLFALATNVFSGIDKNTCTLYVPYGAKETYASTAGWSEFTNIVELEPETIGGSCGDNVNWTYDNGLLTISGNGAMDDYTWPKSSPWTEYKSEIKTVVIEDGVTSIGGEAFVGCTGLTSIEIPSSVNSIANYAFYDCTALTAVCISDLASWCNVDLGGKSNPLSNVCNLYLNGALLTELVIPDGVSKIKDWVFSNCCSLTSVTIPSSVTSIGGSAFYNCTGLTSVTIPSSVKSIESLAFGFCSNVKTITIGFGVKDYCKAFVGTYAEEVYISDLTDLCESYMNSDMGWLFGTKLFLNGELITDLIIPDGVTTISNYLFLRCTTITSVTFSESVTRIGDYAFYNCDGLTSVVIPNSVTSIGGSAFEGCRHLESVTSLIPAEDLFTISNNVFDSVNKNTCTLYVPYGAKETYASTAGWSEFTNIVELEPETTEVTITINQYGSATYCSPYALDFTQVEGLKAYSAIGYKPSTQVVTLARVMTTGAGQGVFIKGEPGEYTVPVIDNFDEYTLNMLVGTLKQTTVNSTDGAMSNYKFTVAEGDEAPMFYPFEDNTTLSAGKAYLQIPTAWLPSTAQKSVSIHFNEGETTDIDEVKGEDGEVKTVYDLQGRVVENPTSGIYIVNGKKVIIK